jgi:hypothetical protein
MRFGKCDEPGDAALAREFMPDGADGAEGKVFYDALENVPDKSLVAQGIRLTINRLDQPLGPNDHLEFRGAAVAAS